MCQYHKSDMITMMKSVIFYLYTVKKYFHAKYY